MDFGKRRTPLINRRCFFGLWVILFLPTVYAQPIPPVYWRAAEAMGNNDYPTARRLFSTMLLGKDFYFNAYWRLAQCYALEGRFDQGQIFFENLLQKGAPAGEVYSALAFLAELQGDHQRIAEYCWQAVQQRTEFLSIHQKLIDWAPASGLEQQVREHLETRLAQNPEDWLAQYTLAYWETLRERPEVSAAKFARLIAAGHQSWRIYFRWAVQLMLMNQLDAAHVVLVQGLLTLQEINDKDGEGRLLNLQGHIYMRQGRLNIADSLLTRAKQLSVATGYLDLQVELAATFSGLRLRQGRLQDALVQAKLAKELSAKLHNEFGELEAYHYTADAYRALGLYEKAIQEWTQAYQLADSLKSESHRHLMAHNLAVVYQTLGDHQRAQSYFEEVVAYTRQYQQPFYLASYLRSLAATLAAQNRLHAAKQYYEEALSIAQKSRLADLQCGLMLDLAALWQRSNNWPNAEKAAIAALTTARQAQLKTSTSDALSQLAEVALHNHQLAKAEERFREAQRLSAETGDYISLITSVNGLGRVAMAMGNDQKAVTILTEGVDLVSRRVFSERAGTTSPFLPLEKELFFSLSRAYVHLRQPARALDIAERMRDLIVRRRLQQAGLMMRVLMADSLRQFGAHLDTLLLKKRLHLAALSSADSTAAGKMKLRLEIADLELQQNMLFEKINPMTEKSVNRQTARSLAAFQQKLAKRRELAVVYLVGNEEVLIFALDGDTLSAHEVPLETGTLQALVGKVNPALKYALQDSQHLQLVSPLLFRYEPQAAARLYQMLLARFVEGAPAQKLLIIPDEHLHFLPFELLLQTASADTVARDYRRLAFMMKNYTFRYASSLQAAFAEAGREKIPATVLAFAQAAPQADDGTTDARDLWQTRREVEAIRKTLGRAAVKIMDGAFAADRKWQNDLRAYAVLHFAAHSEAQNAEPLSSRIILAERRTGLVSLYAFEIFAMHLPGGRLAFLSSCNSASGILRGSEGLQTFAQAFRAAGIPSVIGSLWPADTETGAALAEQFYLHLRAGESAAAALRQAKLSLLAGERANPFFWAAFQYYGVDQTLRFQQSINSAPFFTGLFIAVLIGVARRRLRRPRQVH